MNGDAGQPLLEVRGICKSFPGVQALSNVDLTLRRGEVLAVVGENGAGKSTLMKILAGVERADAGAVRIDGRDVRFRNVQEALDAGVALIHQELNLAGNLDVGANICLGREPRRFGFLDRGACAAKAARHLRELGQDISPWTRVDDLAIGRRQMVEIAKALSVETRVLIMDEPTSSLSPLETERLFVVIRSLQMSGVSILYISHRLAEVETIADRVMVLRDGAKVGELPRAEIDHDTMVRMMIGRDVARLSKRGESAPGEPLLEVRALRSPAHPLHPIDLDLRAGEIVGIAGLVGAGRTELLECLFGVTRRVAGSIRVAGRPVVAGDILSAVQAGMALVPEDRQLNGLFGEQSVRDNLSITSVSRQQRTGFRSRAEERRVAHGMIERLRIALWSDRQDVQTLSGGNQQKVVIGKWLAVRPRVLLLDEPTRGVDVGAKAEIYRLMEELVADGVGILFASSELEELLGIADRVLVMKDGRIAGALDRAQMSNEAIMRLATRAEAAA